MRWQDILFFLQNPPINYQIRKRCIVIFLSSKDSLRGYWRSRRFATLDWYRQVRWISNIDVALTGPRRAFENSVHGDLCKFEDALGGSLHTGELTTTTRSVALLWLSRCVVERSASIHYSGLFNEKLTYHISRAIGPSRKLFSSIIFWDVRQSIAKRWLRMRGKAQSVIEPPQRKERNVECFCCVRKSIFLPGSCLYLINVARTLGSQRTSQYLENPIAPILSSPRGTWR